VDGNSVSNSIYQNSFVNNQGELSQGFDNGIDNLWYNPFIMKGNRWSDWTGVGSYLIAGSANSFDIYPLSGFNQY